MSEKNIVEVNRLGLAAYIAMHGNEIKEVRNGIFFIKTERSISSWEMEYLNSCCQRHDSMLIQLRNQIRN